jgi:hypothetical protein
LHALVACCRDDEEAITHGVLNGWCTSARLMLERTFDDHQECLFHQFATNIREANPLMPG